MTALIAALGGYAGIIKIATVFASLYLAYRQTKKAGTTESQLELANKSIAGMITVLDAVEQTPAIIAAKQKIKVIQTMLGTEGAKVADLVDQVKTIISGLGLCSPDDNSSAAQLLRAADAIKKAKEITGHMGDLGVPKL